MFKSLKEKFNQLGQSMRRLGDKELNRLSDRQLRNVARASTAMGALAVGHAGLWVAIALAGAVALGLHAAGLAIPAFIGGATIGLGALFAVKSATAKVLFTVIDRKCKAIMEKRGLVKPAPAPASAPAPTAGADSKVATTAPLAESFTPVASNTPPAAPPATPALDVKPPEPPKP